jgi:hypothetical protein
MPKGYKKCPECKTENPARSRVCFCCENVFYSSTATKTQQKDVFPPQFVETPPMEVKTNENNGKKYSAEKLFAWKLYSEYGIWPWRLNAEFDHFRSKMSEEEREQHLASRSIPWNAEVAEKCGAYQDNGDVRTFEIDYYIQEAQTMVELKHCRMVGSTEQKIEFEMTKYLNREYLDTGKHYIIYIWGPSANDPRIIRQEMDLKNIQERLGEDWNLEVIIEPSYSIEPFIDALMREMDRLNETPVSETFPEMALQLA